MIATAVGMKYSIKELSKRDEIRDFLSTPESVDFFDSVIDEKLSIWAARWYLETVLDDRSRLLQVWDSDKLVALFPYSVERSFAIECVKAHRFDLFPEQVDVIVAQGADLAVLETILKGWLCKQHVVDIDGIEESATIFRSIQSIEGSLKTETDSGRVLYSFPEFDQLLENSTRNFRSSMSRASKRFEALGISYTIDPNPNEEQFESFLELHTQQFGQASELVKHKDAFMELLRNALAKKGVLLVTASHEAEAIAIDIWFKEGSRFYLINTGRLVTKEYKALGNMIVIKGLSFVFKLGALSASMMRPDLEYKQKMGGEVLPMFRIRCTKSSFWWKMYRITQELKKVKSKIGK